MCVWGESVVTRRNNQGKDPEHAWHFGGPARGPLVAEAKQVKEGMGANRARELGCQAVQGCPKGFGSAE